jgi:hypothetical protein
MEASADRADGPMNERRQLVAQTLIECLIELDVLGERDAAIDVDRAINRLTAFGGPLPEDIVRDYRLPIQ